MTFCPLLSLLIHVPPYCSLGVDSKQDLTSCLDVACMEEQLVADRSHLRRLLHDHPDWPYQEYADQIGRPRDWVKRWVKRLRAAPADDETVLWNRSSARHHLPPRCIQR